VSELAKTRRPLPALAKEIRHDIEAADRHWQSAVEHAIRAGEGLIEAKGQLKHGEWLPWLRANFDGFSERSAQNYMRLAQNRNAVSHLPSVREAVALLAEPKQDGQDDGVREIVGATWDILTSGQRGHLRQLWAVARADAERLRECFEDMGLYVRAERNIIYVDARLEILAWSLLYWAEHPGAPLDKVRHARRRGHALLADVESGRADEEAAS
jgi:Protein of unknown function (DUF3102)